MKIDDDITRILKKEKARERRGPRQTKLTSSRHWRRVHRKLVKGGHEERSFKVWLRAIRPASGELSPALLSKISVVPEKPAKK